MLGRDRDKRRGLETNPKPAEFGAGSSLHVMPSPAFAPFIACSNRRWQDAGKHPSKSHDRNAEGNLDHCLMIVYIHCQYPSAAVTGCEADIVQQLIPRDKEGTGSRFGLQHKIVTAFSCNCIFRQLFGDIKKKYRYKYRIVTAFDAFVCFVSF